MPGATWRRPATHDLTPEQREGLRAALIARAQADVRITGAALTGSASVGRRDRWSDIDLAFGIADGTQLAEPLADWIAHMDLAHGAVHHLDTGARDGGGHA